MKTIMDLHDQFRSRLFDETRGKDIKQWCIDNDLYYRRENNKGGGAEWYKDFTKMARKVEHALGSEYPTKETVAFMLEMAEMMPTLLGFMDLTPIYSAEDFFWGRPTVPEGTTESTRAESVSFLCSLYGYHLDGEWPVPLVSIEHGGTIMARLSDALGMSKKELAHRLFLASKARKAAMNGLEMYRDKEQLNGQENVA